MSSPAAAAPLHSLYKSIKLYGAFGSCSLSSEALLYHLNVPFEYVRMVMGPLDDDDKGSDNDGKQKKQGWHAADGSLSHAEYRAAVHPMGYVPALVLEAFPSSDDDDKDNSNKVVITEQAAVLTTIAQLAGNTGLLGDGDSDAPLGRVRAIEWMVWLSGTLHGTGFGALWRPGRFVGHTEAGAACYPIVVERGKEVIRGCFGRIEERLVGNNGKDQDRGEEVFAVGRRLTVVDFNLYIFFRWASQIGEDTTPFPTYAALARQMEGLEGVKKAVAHNKQHLILG